MQRYEVIIYESDIATVVIDLNIQIQNHINP